MKVIGRDDRDAKAATIAKSALCFFSIDAT
jgi:hypothetical protein